MTPIISPWIFYAISVCDTIIPLTAIIAILSGILGIVCIAVSADIMDRISRYPSSEHSYDKKQIELLQKYSKRLLIICGISILLVIFVPDRETIFQMILAQNVTYERLEMGANIVSAIYEDILNVMSQK